MRYDRQCETIRAPYLYTLIRLTDAPERFRDAILKALYAPGESGDLYQRFELARRFAQDGDADARRALYDAFTKGAAQNDYTGADDLVQLDGIDGLLFALDLMLRPDAEPDEWEPDGLLYELEDREGEEAAWQQLETAAVDRPELAALLAARKRADAKRDSKQSRPDASVPYAVMHSQINGGPHIVGPMTWGRIASKEELRLAAEDTLAETDPKRLTQYLRIFHFRKFPLDFRPLFAHVQNRDHLTLSAAATRTLARITHPEIRAFALSLASVPEHADDAVRLLSRNYELGDYALVTRLTVMPYNDDLRHWFGLAVNDFVERNLSPEAESVLLWLYEHGPCSICRGGAVDLLEKLGLLPEAIRRELPYDAYAGNQERAGAADALAS